MYPEISNILCGFGQSDILRLNVQISFENAFFNSGLVLFGH